nr:hypothetical protein [Saprospiraceae bacterium]
EENSALGNGEFNRIFGLDHNFASPDNKWSGKAFYHRSLSPNQKADAFAHGTNVNFVNNKMQLNWRHEIVGGGYDAQIGFVRRTDYQRIRPQAFYYFFTDKFNINRHGPVATYELVNQNNLGVTDKTFNLRYSVEFLNNSFFDLTYSNQFVYLFNPFDPTGTQQKRLEKGTSYQYNFLEALFFSDNSKKFSYTLRAGFGEYFNGSRIFTSTRLAYRFEPKINLSVTTTYNHFSQNHLDKNVTTWLLSPTVDITFSKSLFWTTYIQYNSQIQNTNINTRLQWRYAPVSDFFLVFTNNSFTGDVGPEARFMIQRRDQAIVAKWTYWLNV